MYSHSKNLSGPRANLLRCVLCRWSQTLVALKGARSEVESPTVGTQNICAIGKDLTAADPFGTFRVTLEKLGWVLAASSGLDWFGALGTGEEHR